MRTIGVWMIAALFSLCCLAPRLEAKALRMIGPEIPPHFDREGRGRIADVVSAVLDRCSHSVSFTVVPFGRHWKDYTDNDLFDGLATAEADQEFPGYSTKPFMHLQDGATVFAGQGLAGITTVAELSGKSIVAFPAADKILGIEALVPGFKSFTMRADRFDQIRLLLSSRVDAILADGLITANFIRILRDRALAGEEPDVNPVRALVFRRIFHSGPQRLYFRDPVVTADFDRCFADLLTDGTVERLAKPYVDRYRDILGDQYPTY